MCGCGGLGAAFAGAMGQCRMRLCARVCVCMRCDVRAAVGDLWLVAFFGRDGWEPG